MTDRAQHGSVPAGPPAQGLELLSAPPQLVSGVALVRLGPPADQAPTVVLLHGLGSARTTWAPVLAPLITRYHVVALDLPGHGDSAPLAAGHPADPAALADLVQVTLHAAEVGSAHLMGSSLGGWISLELAATGRAASLTLLAPAGLRAQPNRPSRWLIASRRLAQLTGAAADPLLGSALVRRFTFAQGSADPAALDPALARSAARAMRRCADYERILAGATGRRFERADRIAIPTTVAFGDDDKILPAPDNQYRPAAPADAHWVTIRRCGHAPMWDAPQECVRLLDRTVDSATGS